jgi:hypothetical protein
MGKKIFVTYKYSDSKVLAIPGNNFTTVRHYVDELQSLIEVEDHINKGEEDGEDLSDFKEGTITSRLRDKIFDSSITIVMISKGMKDPLKSEDDQWMPWEISYSLKELTRDGKTSKTNAVLAVVLPDENGSYDYFLTYNEKCNSTTYNTSFLFGILRNNMFNIKKADTRDCNGNTIYNGYFSYIHCVKWVLFKNDINTYIGIATKIKENKDDYNITKTVG